MHFSTRRSNQTLVTLTMLVCLVSATANAAGLEVKPKAAAAAKPALPTPVKPAAVPAGAGKAPAMAAPKSALPTPGGLPAGEFAQIQQMRDMQQIKEMSDALRVGGLGAAPVGPDIANPAGSGLSRPGNRFDQMGKAAGAGNNNQPSGYGNPFPGVPMPALPSNRDKQPRGALNLVPSGNLRDHASGIAGQDSSGRPRRITGTQTESASTSDGLSYRRTTTSFEDGDEMTTERSTPGSGSSYTHTTADYPTNTYTHVNVLKDENGNVIKETQSGTLGPDGQVPEETGDDHGAAPARAGGGGDPAATQDPNADTNTGGCNPITGLCQGKGAQDPNRVNPGRDGANSTASAPPLQIDRRTLVGDPDMVKRAGTGTPRMMAPGNPMNRVNPPGPNDGSNP